MSAEHAEGVDSSPGVSINEKQLIIDKPVSAQAQQAWQDLKMVGCLFILISYYCITVFTFWPVWLFGYVVLTVMKEIGRNIYPWTRFLPNVLEIYFLNLNMGYMICLIIIVLNVYDIYILLNHKMFCSDHWTFRHLKG